MFTARAAGWLRQLGYQTADKTHTQIVNGIHAVGNLLFPPTCTFCHREITPGTGEPHLCQFCLIRFTLPRFSCRRCASPLPAHWNDSRHCPRCQHRRYHFDRAVALGEYQTELQQAVLRMKRLAHEPLTRAMGELLAVHTLEELEDWGVDQIVPVPMHFWRRLKRGTHTAHVLGGRIAAHFGLTVPKRLLYCRRKSLKQGTLSPAERFRNMRGAFSISPGYDITDKRVLLVDDILTTGATASEAARVLRQAGAAAVAVTVVARGIGRR